MKIVRSPLIAARFCRQALGKKTLVPTMGALHGGHLALIRRARTLAGANGTVIVSIFVNPAQFGPGEDFSKYPRPFAQDARLCREHGADLLFAPDAGQMDAPDHSVFVDENSLGAVLCGAARPGHFRGVCTVVAKLFNIVAPDVAVFGTKDFQQLAIIKRMVRDLNFAVKIVPVETVREPDGVALSSRNRYLSRAERAQAPVIRRALLAAKAAAGTGSSPVALKRLVAGIISEAPLAKTDYVEVLDAETLRPVSRGTQGVVIAAAVFFGKTRLIDNVRFKL